MSQDLIRQGVGARLSEAAIFNRVVYLAGMVPERGDTDIRGQTEDVLAQVEQRLIEAGNLPLLCAIAPRGLCLLQASDDARANPPGTRHTFEQLQPHWAAQGVGHRLDWQERTGGHPMTALDWRRAAGFLRRVFGEQGV